MILKTSPADTLIVFDLVSTLTDAGPRYARAFADVCQTHGYGTPDDDAVMGMLGEKNLKQITEHFIGPLETDEQHDFMQACNMQCDNLLYHPAWIEKLYPHVRETLAGLRDDGYTLGIFTGTREDAALNQLRYHNIQHYFNPAYIRGKDNDRDGGMDNDALKIQQLSSIHTAFGGQKTVIVGDSASDHAAASHLGLDFIGFSTKPTNQAYFTRHGVDAIDGYEKFGGCLDRVMVGPTMPRNMSAAPGFQ